MIPKRPFGRTGHLSTRTIFGGAAFWRCTQEVADRTLEMLLEYGINHIDTAASYGDSELRIGPWMREHRDHFFLATKTEMRTYREARDELHRSLERLRVDSVDLLQLHYLVKPEEWDIAMGAGGVLEMAVEARDQGLIRFIGVTGHDVAIAGMHMRSLERFDFDSILLPYSYILMQNPVYAEGFNALMDVCRERNVAVQTIKAVSRRRWAEDQTRSHITWYEPLTDQDAIDKSVNWVLGNGQVFLNTVGDLQVLPKVLDAAKRQSERPSDAEMDAMLAEYEMSPLFT